MNNAHSLGNKNSNNIGVKYRDIHPSFIGNIDLLTCGNSDPGTSGILTPFGKIKGFMFDDKSEPDVFIPEFVKDVRKKMEDDGVNYVCVDFGDDIASYYDVLLQSKELLKDGLKLKVTSRDLPEIVVEHEDIEIPMDDDRNKSMRHARSKK